MKRIEIISCDNCKFSYTEENDAFVCGLSENKLDISTVMEGELHGDCPMRKGPIQFCLAKDNAGANDVARTKKCRDCGRSFDITYGELQFLADKFPDSFGEPSRCRPCRKAKKNNGDGEEGDE